MRLLQRLRFLARGGDAVHFLADDQRVAGDAAEHRLDDYRALGQLAVAIGVAEPLGRPFLDSPVLQHQGAADKDVLHLAAIGAAVHPDEAADRSGNAAQELEPGDPRVARGRGNEDAATPRRRT